jgi:hypothetical protein
VLRILALVVVGGELAGDCIHIPAGSSISWGRIAGPEADTPRVVAVAVNEGIRRELVQVGTKRIIWRGSKSGVSG